MASTLPNPSDCCLPSCDGTETVEVPGPAGADGANGANGADGINAFTTITDAFNMPAEGADTASLLVGNSQWMTPNQIVYVSNAGWMEVRSKADSTHVVLRNIENTASARYTDNVPPATPVAGGQSVSPGGLQGVNGVDGSNGAAGTNGVNAFTATTADFTQPAELATVNVEVANSTWVSIGQILFVQGGGHYEVTAVPDSTHVTLKNLEDTANDAYPGNTAPAANITFPKTVSPAGLQGPVGATGAAGGTSVSNAEQAGVGTDYTITNAYAQIVFGTTNAELILLGVGTYLIQAIINLEARGGSTFDTLRFKIRDTTNNVDLNEQTIIFENQNRTQVVLSDLFAAAGGETIELWAVNDTAAGGTIYSTETKLWYLKLT